jgi:cytochrome c2
MSERAGALAVAGVLTLTLLVSACSRGLAPLGLGPAYQQVPGGDAERGRAAIRAYGCGACHAIPGVAGARGRVAPALHEYGQREVIVGLVPNTPERLVAWIQTPSSLRQGTTMPNLGLTPADARDIAAYLYTLH